MADSKEPRPRRADTPASRLLRPAARAGERLAGVTGIDRAIEDAAEEAIVRALRSPAVERAIERVIEENSIEDAVQRALTSEQVADAVIAALDTEAADKVWEELLRSNKAQMLVERVAEAPEVRAAIAQQGFGLITDIGRRLTKITEALDDVAEKVLHRILGRGDAESETNQAGLVTRGLAGAIDTAGLLALLSVSSGLLASIFGGSGDLPTLAVIAAISLGFLVGGGIFVTFWSLVGQTPGMRFLSIRLDVDGSREIGLRRAVKRLLAIPVSAGVAGLGFLAIMTDPRRRAWHDRFAGTEVVYDDSTGIATWSGSSGQRRSGGRDASGGRWGGKPATQSTVTDGGSPTERRRERIAPEERG